MSQVHNESHNQVRDYDTIIVTPCTPHIGTEIGNIDLTRPLSNRQVQEVHDAIIAHGVIFFRNHKIDFASHERLVRYFGEPHVHVGGRGTASKSVPGYPGIRHQYFDAGSKRVSGEEWHSDQSCADIPPMYSVLYQEIIPPNGGGDTMFASAYKAYEELSPSMKTYLEGKTATQDGARACSTRTPMSIRPPFIRWSFATRKAAARRCSSTANSRVTSTKCRRRKVAAYWNSSTTTSRGRIGIMRSGTIGRMSARATACSSKAPSALRPSCRPTAA
jgi:taurine dioxygenase